MYKKIYGWVAKRTRDMCRISQELYHWATQAYIYDPFSPNYYTHIYAIPYMIYEFPFQHINYGLQLGFRIMYMCNNLYLFNIKYLGLLSSEICRILFMISRSESSGKVTLQRAEIDGGTALRFSGTNEHFSFDWGWWLKYPNNQGNKTARKTTCSFL